MAYNSDDQLRRERIKNMYAKYRDHIHDDSVVFKENTTPGFYSIKEEQGDIPKHVVTMVPRNAKNRFKKYHTISGTRSAVRSELRKLFKEKKKQPSNMRNLLNFVGTTVLAFSVMLLVFNASSYFSIASDWYQKISTNGEAYQSFALFNKNDKEKLPTTLVSAEPQEPAKTRSLFPSLSDLDLAVTPPDNRIIIPSIGKNIPIQDISNTFLLEENWPALENELQGALKDGVVRYPGTAIPGQIGNVFITGHSSYYLWDPGRYKDVFALLHNVEIGETVTIYYNQKEYKYIIEEKNVVNPNDIDVLKQSDDKRLTLMTCTPIGTALNRLILVAKQVS